MHSVFSREYNGQSGEAETMSSFEAEFNYNQSLKTKIKKAGFGYIDSELRGVEFCRREKGKKIKQTKLFNFFFEAGDYLLLTNPATKMILEGYKPANIFELCDVAAVNPWFSLYFPVVALDSMWLSGSYINFPAVDSCTYSFKKQLTAFRFWTEGNVVWPKYCRFLAIQEH